jgi:hypothetical protein
MSKDRELREERRQRLEERLSALLERVRIDARTAPEAYADETEVPEGGE